QVPPGQVVGSETSQTAPSIAPPVHTPPSSHSSPGLTTLLPQTYSVRQVALHMSPDCGTQVPLGHSVGSLAPTSTQALPAFPPPTQMPPSSHCSVPSMSPSPQRISCSQR